MADFPGTFLAIRIFQEIAQKDHVGQLIAGNLRGGAGSPPTIENVSPPDGSAISPDATCFRDVIDVDGSVTTALFARFVDTWEVIFDGVNFSPKYSSSIRTNITNGRRFEIRRNGGWPGSFSIGSVDVDDTGLQP